VERIQGRGRIEDPHAVAVRIRGEERKLTTKFILIATGSRPNRPKHIPFDSENVFDATTVLEMTRVPESMVIVGGGVIGSEYACLFDALGMKTYLVHAQPRPMNSMLDGEIAGVFMSRMRASGIDLCMNDSVESCHVEGGTVKTRLKSGRELTSDTLLWAIGRDGNTDGLGLEKLGIAVNKYKNIDKVDRITYQTSVPNIYAAGDVAGMESLASTSMEQGRLAMCHAFDLKYKTRLAPILPAGIYTIPEISFVGRTEEQCRKEGIPFVVGREVFGRHARGQIIGDTDGMIKLIVSAIDGKLLGVHVIGEIASEIAHVGMACLHFDGDIDFFIGTCFNYPTLCDVYKYAAYDALGKLNQVRQAAAGKAAEINAAAPK
jgi:NAD(P) transhydrogenase